MGVCDHTCLVSLWGTCASCGGMLVVAQDHFSPLEKDPGVSLPDPKAGLAPLFEVQLDLVIPDLVFRPSLDPGTNDGFYGMVESLLNDIYRISSLVPRLAEHSGFPHYQVCGCGAPSCCVAVRRYHAAPASLHSPLLS